MRLVADGLEAAGIATVIVGVFMRPLSGAKRVILTGYDRGKTFGEPGDVATHESIAARAVALLRDAFEPTTIRLPRPPRAP